MMELARRPQLQASHRYLPSCEPVHLCSPDSASAHLHGLRRSLTGIHLRRHRPLRAVPVVPVGYPAALLWDLTCPILHRQQALSNGFEESRLRLTHSLCKTKLSRLHHAQASRDSYKCPQRHSAPAAGRWLARYHRQQSTRRSEIERHRWPMPLPVLSKRVFLDDHQRQDRSRSLALATLLAVAMCPAHLADHHPRVSSRLGMILKSRL